MSLVIMELENIQMARAGWSSCTLGGQYVDVERAVARQRQAPAVAWDKVEHCHKPTARVEHEGELSKGDLLIMAIWGGPFLGLFGAVVVSAGLAWLGVPEDKSGEFGLMALPTSMVGLPTGYVLWLGLSALRRLRDWMKSRQV